MKFLKTIRGRLFACYACIVVVLVALLTGFFYAYTARVLESRASESLQQLAVNLNQYLDAEFTAMSDAAGRIISSGPIKERYYAAAGEYASLENQLAMYQLMFTVTGSSIPYQINIVSDSGRLAQFGKQNDLALLNPEELQRAGWFAPCVRQEGRPYITRPYRSLWGQRDEEVVSVCRAMNPSFSTRYDSAVEVQVPLATLLHLVQSSITLPNNQANRGVAAFVYDGEGRLVLASAEDAVPASGYYGAVTAAGRAYGTLQRKGEGEILAHSTSAFSGWTVVVREQESRLLAPVWRFRNWVLLIGAAALGITLLITYLIARQLTVPIRSIQASIDRLNLADLGEDSAVPSRSSPYELNQLSDAYLGMVNRLQDSLDETVSARFQEMRARLLALQAQMDPHFLYNTITIISITAENNNDDEVVRLCENLTGMLRYISKESSTAVTVAVELAHLEQYLFLMESRYAGRFTVTVDIPAALREVVVPKLVIQPILENCFKYAFNTHPPWLASIRGEIQGNHWRITVADNGTGFSEEALQALQERVESGAFRFAAEETDKIGLLNIYHRLHFLYRDSAVFEVENLPEGGSRVTIGGLVDREEGHEW